MKLIKYILFLTILILTNASSVELSIEEKEYIKDKKIIYVSNEYDYEPYDFNFDGNPAGYSIDLLELLLKDIDLEIRYVTKPWTKLVEDLDNGKIDLVHTLYKTPEREKKYLFSMGYSKVIHSFVIRKNKKDVENIEELFGKKVGVSKGWAEEDYFNQFPKIKKVYYENLSDKLNALSIGEIDAISNDENIANYYLRKYGYSNLKISNPVRDRFEQVLDDHYFAALNDNKYLISILNKSYKNTRIEDIEKLNKKWFGSISKDVLEGMDSLSYEEIHYLRNKKLLKMCVLPDWLPFDSIDKNNKHKGIGADIIAIISQYIDTPIELLPTKQWSQSLQNIRDRKCDILPVAMDTPSRRDAMNFTIPYWSEPFVIATKDDKFFIKDSSELANKKIGIVKSYAFIEVLKTKNPTVQIVEVKNAEEGLRRVRAGELFGYVDIMAAIGYNIQEYGFYDIKVAGKLEFDIKLSIASRNDEPLLNSIMQKALNNIKEERRRTIVGKWIEIKLQESIDYGKVLYAALVFLVILLIILYKNRSINKINQELIKVNNEINEQRKIAESLTQYQKTLLTLFDRSDAVLVKFKWYKSGDWTIEYISKSIEKLLGYDSKDFTEGKISYLSCINKEDIKSVKEQLRKNINLKSGYFKHEPYRIISKDGAEKWVLDYIVVVEDAGDSVDLLGYITDITDHIKQQNILLQQSKMASLGEMIGNIAHQWRQPLSVISTVSTGTKLKKELGMLEEEEFGENMELINKNAQFLSKTIDDFKNFIKGERSLLDFKVDDALEQVLGLVEPSIANNYIKIIKKLDSDIVVKGYPNEFIQSIINIYYNAKDVLVLIPEDERFIFFTLKKIGDDAVLKIRDNGGGIKDDIIDRVFEPYVTSKHKSMGTGLGLSITYNFIVSGMNGTISVENINFLHNEKFYKGAEFTIILPTVSN